MELDHVHLLHWKHVLTIHFPFPGEPLPGEIKSDIATYTGLYFGFKGTESVENTNGRGRNSSNLIVILGQEICPCFDSIIILSISLTKEHISVYDFNNCYSLSISYKPNT